MHTFERIGALCRRLHPYLSVPGGFMSCVLGGILSGAA